MKMKIVSAVKQVYLYLYVLCMCVCLCKVMNYIPLMSYTHTCRRQRDSHGKTFILIFVSKLTKSRDRMGTTRGGQTRLNFSN